MHVAEALPAIRRHLNGFGVYGQFPIIVPLYGGGGELCQAFCRAAAVKGATYILGREIKHISKDSNEEYPFQVEFDVPSEEELPSVKSRWVVRPAASVGAVESTRRVAVFEGLLDGLFGGEGVHVDAALVVVPPSTVREEQRMPIQMIVHGGGIGECPVGQCMLRSCAMLIVGVVYSSIESGTEGALQDLDLAERMLIQNITGSEEKGIMSLRLRLIAVEPLLLATYKCRSSGTGSSQDGIVYVKPPSNTKDYDDAFHEAKRIFTELFGHEEDFFVGDDTEDIEPSDD
jgi:GDP dissociation inhibitor